MSMGPNCFRVSGAILIDRILSQSKRREYHTRALRLMYCDWAGSRCPEQRPIQPFAVFNVRVRHGVLSSDNIAMKKWNNVWGYCIR